LRAQIQASTPKQQVAALVGTWIERVGIQKQTAAARAGMDYLSFHRAYIDSKRNLNLDPIQAIAVVRAFVIGWPQDARCTAAEAIAFCSLVQLPLPRYEELRELFPPDQWQAAFNASFSLPDTHAQGKPARPAVRVAAESEALPDLAALPIPHRMPLIRNPLFHGRADDLRMLDRHLLHQADGDQPQAVAITGIGGMGKTNLATEFVYRYGQFFAGGVFWLNCTDPRALPAELAACGGAGLIARDDWSRLPIEDQVRLVRQAWQEPIARLLIFDNCEDVETLSTWRPTSGDCRVLLTSRREAWPRALGVATLPLRELRRAESVAMLRSYRPDLLAESADIDALAAELGDLPLALHLAGSYLEVYQHTPPFDDPARLLNDLRAGDLLDHDALRGVDAAPSATDHDPHVARTFTLGLGRLALDDPTDAQAHALLSRVGYLAPNTPFPRALLPALLGLDRADADAQKRAARALHRLVALGFLHAGALAITIHPLVAAFARRIGAAEMARADVERALIECVEIAYPADDFQTLRDILPHFQRLADATPDRADELAARLCNTFPFVLEIASDLPGGIRYFERARSILEHTGALDTQLHAEVLNNLAEWYRAVGDLEQARVGHERALEIRKRILDPDDSDIAQSENNVAELLRQQAAYAEARPHYEQALAIWSRRYGAHHVYTLTARSNLASLLFDQGSYTEAQAHFQEVLMIAVADLGADNTNTARAHLNLGKALRGLGDFARAGEHLEAAFTIFRAKYGDEHYDTLRPLHQLALLSADRGRRREARDALRQVLATCARALGAHYPLTEIVRKDLEQLEA
jgi:tetratricopeptide (TPR) repeat protein